MRPIMQSRLTTSCAELSLLSISGMHRDTAVVVPVLRSPKQYWASLTTGFCTFAMVVAEQNSSEISSNNQRDRSYIATQLLSFKPKELLFQ